MGLFSTSASNEAENQAWLANLKATRPDAYAAYKRYLDLTIASQNVPDEGGSATRAARRRMRQQLGYSEQALEEARQNVLTKYPDVAKYASEHAQFTGGLGQGADIIAAAALMLGGGAALAGGEAGAAAGGAGTGTAAGGAAGGAAATGGAGTTVGTTAGTGAAAGGAAGTVTSVGTGAGYSGLTDAAVESGVTAGLGSSGTTAGTGAAAGSGTAAGAGTSGSGIGELLGSNTGQGLLNLGAGYLQGQQNQEAAQQYAQSQIEAARIAAEAARFKPVGVTTRFGQSNFEFDEKGNIKSAGYTLSPEIQAQQNALMGAISGQQPQGMMRIAGARANGGTVSAGQTYLVGERGPEPFVTPAGTTVVGINGPSLLTPQVSGTVIPNSSFAGSGRMYAGGSPGFYSGGAHQTGGGPAVASPVSNIGQNVQQGGLLGQAVNAQQTTAPMGQGAQSLFNLGQGYLTTSPQEQAARYYAEQQALLEPSRASQYANLENRLQQQGRLGLSVGGDGGMSASNPELQAFYNAQRMQDLGLASQATQGGQQYAQFGAGMLGTGADLLRGMYGTQVAAYQPYQTALGAVTGIENLGQQAMTMGSELGRMQSAAGATAGGFLQQGYGNAAQGMLPANQYSFGSNLLQGAANWS
jgi:hypothetical protein